METPVFAGSRPKLGKPFLRGSESRRNVDLYKTGLFLNLGQAQPGGLKRFISLVCPTP